MFKYLLYISQVREENKKTVQECLSMYCTYRGTQGKGQNCIRMFIYVLYISQVCEETEKLYKNVILCTVHIVGTRENDKTVL